MARTPRTPDFNVGGLFESPVARKVCVYFATPKSPQKPGNIEIGGCRGSSPLWVILADVRLFRKHRYCDGYIRYMQDAVDDGQAGEGCPEDLPSEAILAQASPGLAAPHWRQHEGLADV